MSEMVLDVGLIVTIEKYIVDEVLYDELDKLNIKISYKGTKAFWLIADSDFYDFAPQFVDIKTLEILILNFKDLLDKFGIKYFDDFKYVVNPYYNGCDNPLMLG